MAPDIPRQLDHVTARALALSSTERYRDAGAMLAELPATADLGAAPNLPATQVVAGWVPPTHQPASPAPVAAPPASEAPAPDEVETVEATTPATTLGWTNRAKRARSGRRAFIGRWVALALGASAAIALVAAGLLIWTSAGDADETAPEPSEEVAAAGSAKSPPPPSGSGTAEEEPPFEMIAGAEPSEPPGPETTEPQPAPEPPSPAKRTEAPPPRMTKVRLVGLPPRSSVTFGGRAVRGGWITGPEGSRELLVVSAQGFERYHKRLTLKQGQVVDLTGEFSRAERTETKRPDGYIPGPRDSKIKVDVPGL